MSLLHADGFDVSATADLGHDYDVIGTPVVGAYGRFGSGGLQCGSGDAIAIIRSARANFVIGFAMFINDLAPGQIICSALVDSDTGNCHLLLRMNADRSFSIVRAPSGSPGIVWTGGTVLGTSGVNKATVQAWMTFEWKGVLHASAGNVAMKVNGETLLNLSGIDTHNASTSWMKAYLGASSSDVRFDDYWVCDQSGSRLNTFLGDRVVESQAAQAGNGHYTEWTPSTGSDHGAMVDEAASDGDSTYNAAASTNLRDTYTFPATTRLDSVDGVRVTAVARKEGTGTRAIAGLSRVGTTDTVDGTDHYLSTGYAGYVVGDLPLNPATTNPWAVAEVDAAEVGVKTTA